MKRRSYHRLIIAGTLAASAITLNLMQAHYQSRIDALMLRVDALEATQNITTITIEETINEVTICAPDSTFKSWMSYRKITDKTSDQYALQTKALTNDNGIRVYEGHLMVAMASSYGSVGERFRIEFEDGNFILAIIGDIKADTTCTHPDGSQIEFIVDPNEIPAGILRSGNFNDLYRGKITRIERS